MPEEGSFSLVYEELRVLALQRVAGENEADSLNPSDLVHEALLRLFDERGLSRFENSRHLYSTAAQAMRWILVDRARARRSIKRGGDLIRSEFVESQILAPADDDELLAVDDALKKFEKVDEECAEMVKMRFFSGFSLNEIADAMGISYRTVLRRWEYAKAWLAVELKKEND